MKYEIRAKGKTINATDVLEKEIKLMGNSSHIGVPKKYAGRMATILIHESNSAIIPGMTGIPLLKRYPEAILRGKK